MMTNRTRAIEAAEMLTPAWGQKFVMPAFGGDADAASALIFALHDYQRAEMVRLLYSARVGPAAFRCAIEEALCQTHHYSAVFRKASTWRQLVR